MLLMNWKRPKLTKNVLKRQNISLLCKKLMNEEGETAALTKVSLSVTSQEHQVINI